MRKKNSIPKVKLLTVPVSEETHKLIHQVSRERGLRVRSFASLLIQSSMDNVKAGKVKIVTE